VTPKDQWHQGEEREQNNVRYPVNPQHRRSFDGWSVTSRFSFRCLVSCARDNIAMTKRENRSEADNVSLANVVTFSNPGLPDELGLDDLRQAHVADQR